MPGDYEQLSIHGDEDMYKICCFPYSMAAVAAADGLNYFVATNSIYGIITTARRLIHE